VSGDTRSEGTQSQTAPGKGRWPVLGASFGCAPSICSLAFLDRLDLPTWLVLTVILASPIVGALLGLLSYVVVALTDRQTMINRLQVEAAADAIRQSLAEPPQLKPGYAIEAAIKRMPDGFGASIHCGKERAGGPKTTSTGHVAGQKHPLPSGNGDGAAMPTSDLLP
jgi:hypothetical protein